MKVLQSVCTALFLLFTLGQLRSQIPHQSTSQEFDIQASLDVAEQLLDVEYNLRYTNTSTDTLSSLIFHLWAQAFSDPLSAYGRQKLLFGDAGFYFLPPDERIGYRFLQFSQGPDFLRAEQIGPHVDIVRLHLNTDLLPGQEVILHADYQLALPGFHSRLGTDGEIWQLAHWFPKPARYVDHEWQTIPYLEMGEFTQDFAGYKVSLTLPDSFVVVSTGAPANDRTRSIRQEALDHTKNGQPGMPHAAGTSRTWSFSAARVPDFAMALSAHYFLEEVVFSLQNGSTVVGQCAYTPARKNGWKNGLQYVRAATQFYDEHVGPYPWPYVSAIQGVKEFSGGMEYPMITYIQPGISGASLDEVIAHEVGHNWFYGVLSTNERLYPWMDEGLNSYFDHRYTASRQTHSRFSQGFDTEGWLLRGEAGKHLLPIPAEGIQHMYSEIDYLVGAYTIPERVFRTLENLVGLEATDHAFQQYYQRWQFDHPLPGDLRSVFEHELGIDLEWLFGDALSKPFVRDLSIRKARHANGPYHITIRQQGLKGLPWSLRQMDGDSTLQEDWWSGFLQRDTTVEVSILPGTRTLSVRDGIVPDLHPANDQYRMAGPFHRKTGWGVGIGLGVYRAPRLRTYVLPIISKNVYDGFQAGLALHNQKVYYQPAGYFLGVLYGFRSKRFGYSAAVYQDIYLSEGPAFVRMGLRARSNSYYTFGQNDLRYHRFEPYAEWQNQAEIRADEMHWRVGLYAWFIGRQELDFDGEFPQVAEDLTWDRILSLRSTITHKEALLPWSISLDTEFQLYRDAFDRQQGYVKTGIEFQLANQFLPKRYIHFRSFIGGFPYNSRRESGNVSNPSTRGSYALSFQGIHDYRFEDPFLGRSEYTGTASRQILIQEGGFKTALGPAFGDGQSNHFIASVNIRSDLPLPIRLPIQIYSDLGYWSDHSFIGQNKTLSDQIWWDFGLEFNILDDRIQIFFPLVQNTPLNQLLKQRDASYWSRVTWSIDLSLLQLPWDFPALF
ncbi:MAG: M1 family metallopeptidase [Saprospiraceae bacterium]|nr:M1 family metallopeptidase [Saprospiraceae bacterium]